MSGPRPESDPEIPRHGAGGEGGWARGWDGPCGKPALPKRKNEDRLAGLMWSDLFSPPLLPNSELHLEDRQPLPPRAIPRLRSGRREVRVSGERKAGRGLKLRQVRPFVQTRLSDGGARLSAELLGRGGLVKCASRKLRKGRGLPKYLEGRGRRPHLPGGGRRGAGGLLGAPWGRAVPLPPAPHSASSFARGGSWPPKSRGVSDPGYQRATPFPVGAPGPPPSCPALSRPAHWRGREMGREARRKPLPAAPAKKHNTAQCRRARLAPVNSGGLCSRQLFPGHLTCQLLGKCCC